MKHIAVVLFFLLVFPMLFISTQTSGQNKFHVGPTFGLGICSMHDKAPSADKKIHFHTGIVGSYTISKKFKLQPALFISTKGYGSDLNSPNAKVNLTYIDATFPLKFFA
jgi:hypothetical protein